MPGLLDIAVARKTVPAGGTDIPVYGVSAAGIAVILDRFPVVRELFAGVERTPITADLLFKMVPDAIATIIAAGCGEPGNEAAELAASRLPAHEQADLLEEILRLTMPKGVGPFVDRLMGLAGLFDAESMSIPGLKSPAQSSPSQEPGS